MNKTLIAIMAASVSLSALPVSAQTPAPAAQPVLRHGAVIPGFCILSRNQVIGTSQVGKYVVERVRQLDAPSEAELKASGEAFEKDVQAFQASRATLSQEAVAQQGATLNQRAAQLDQLYQVRARESEITRNKALERVVQEMTPLVYQAYQARNCSVLIDASAVFTAASGHDISEDVVRLLDAKITQFPFERERAEDQQQAAPAAAAPAAARPAAAARPRAR